MRILGKLDGPTLRAPEPDAPDYECDLCAESGECDGACMVCPICKGRGCDNCGEAR